MHFIESKYYDWKEISLSDFAQHVQGKKVMASIQTDYSWETGYGILLDDRTVCISISRCTGPLSEVTPDIYIDEPDYFIGTPKSTISKEKMSDDQYLKKFSEGLL